MTSIRASLFASGLLHAVVIGGVGYFAASAAGSGRVQAEVKVQLAAADEAIEPLRTADELRVRVEPQPGSAPVEAPRMPEEWLDPRLFEPAPPSETEVLPGALPRAAGKAEAWLTLVRPSPVVAPPTPPAVPSESAPPAPTVEVIAGENPPPDYPWVARRRGLEGVVAVSVVVDAAGVVTAASVLRTSWHEVLDAAALRAVRLWRFRHGPGTTVVEVEFALRER